MRDPIHTVLDDDGRGDLDVSSVAGGRERGPMIQFTITDAHGARYIAAQYEAVESLYNALGSWLFDTLLTSHTVQKRRKR